MIIVLIVVITVLLVKRRKVRTAQSTLQAVEDNSNIVNPTPTLYIGELLNKRNNNRSNKIHNNLFWLPRYYKLTIINSYIYLITLLLILNI